MVRADGVGCDVVARIGWVGDEDDEYGGRGRVSEGFYRGVREDEAGAERSGSDVPGGEERSAYGFFMRYRCWGG